MANKWSIAERTQAISDLNRMGFKFASPAAIELAYQRNLLRSALQHEIERCRACGGQGERSYGDSKETVDCGECFSMREALSRSEVRNG
jgi:hypothetical protein